MSADQPCRMIRLSDAGEDFDPRGENLLAEGVRGYAMWMPSSNSILIPWIEAVNEGSGAVGRFLDWLPVGVAFPVVINQRLRGMLARRGFVPEARDVGTGDHIEVWVRAFAPNI